MPNAPEKNLRLELAIAPIAGAGKSKGRLVEGGPRAQLSNQLTVNVTVVECVVAPASVPVPVMVTV